MLLPQHNKNKNNTKSPSVEILPKIVVGHGMDVKNGIHHDQLRHFFEVLRYQNLEANKTFLLTEQ